jgi:hypothetical protein
LPRKIPRDGKRNAYPGVRKYLETDLSKRRPAGYNISKYNRAAREVAIEAIESLTLFSERAEDERQLGAVLTDERLDRLVSAWLTQSREKDRQADPSLQDMREREYRTAAMLMQKGTAKCFERIDPENRGLWKLVEAEATRLLAILGYAATGDQASKTGKRADTNVHEYSFQYWLKKSRPA